MQRHFKEVLEYLDEIELPYRLAPHLVRGLDYYTRTVFEVYREGKEDMSQTALGGGGRYDNLVKLLDGKDTPAAGGSLGIDRVAMAMKEANVALNEAKKVKIFLAQLGYLGKKRV